MNLYHSLEVATGTIIEAYDEEHAEQMKKVFPDQVLKKFKELHYEQRFSCRIKSCLFSPKRFIGFSVVNLGRTAVTQDPLRKILNYSVNVR